LSILCFYGAACESGCMCLLQGPCEGHLEKECKKDAHWNHCVPSAELYAFQGSPCPWLARKVVAMTGALEPASGFEVCSDRRSTSQSRLSWFWTAGENTCDRECHKFTGHSSSVVTSSRVLVGRVFVATVLTRISRFATFHQSKAGGGTDEGRCRAEAAYGSVSTNENAVQSRSQCYRPSTSSERRPAAPLVLEESEISPVAARPRLGVVSRCVQQRHALPFAHSRLRLAYAWPRPSCSTVAYSGATDRRRTPSHRVSQDRLAYRRTTWVVPTGSGTLALRDVQQLIDRCSATTRNQ
jgi:hypothetical protein